MTALENYNGVIPNKMPEPGRNHVRLLKFLSGS